jgi:superfamily II DNA/RNA helicase
VLEAVTTSGYTTPTPIQAQAIPRVLERKDVLGIAQTGTGKTAAFTLPMITLLEQGRARARMPRTLILEPTRELAAQVEESFVKYGAGQKLNVALLIGGVSFGDQDVKITRGVDVLIATPGRLLDHFERGKLLLTGIEILVIDEADRMLDMGFIPDIERICKMVPFTRQTLFFSATMPPEIQRITEAFLHNPVRIEIARQATTAETITQYIVASPGNPAQKREVLRRLLRDATDVKNGIIFCNRKTDVQIVWKSLEKHGFSVAALHGDMDQRARTVALDGFRAGTMQYLVASDVAARGLDIPDVSHVFNYDAPHHSEDYVHRIGRTGRAGRLGTAYTLITAGDDKNLAGIEAMIKRKIDWLGPTIDEAVFEDAPREDRSRGRRDSADRGRGRKPSSRPAPSTAPDASEAHAAPQSEARTHREPRPRTEDRPRRDDRPRQDARQEPPKASAAPARPDRLPMDRPQMDRPPMESNRRPRERDDDGPTPKGFGAELPGFLMRSTKAK